ncbi:type 1 periplasmic-binding domain-containing protein [Anianabacter salinae]|uniref:hypothetical protein n=1 Tax=Anianabacter salinae TaxID=2851023 RepID=UPI00225E41C5|nr:hypothetical protein [Anianabacter salinae]
MSDKLPVQQVALREGRSADRVALIVNELTEESRAALIDRYAHAVIATPLDSLCRALVTEMLDAAAGQGGRPARSAPLEPQIYTLESF